MFYLFSLIFIIITSPKNMFNLPIYEINSIFVLEKNVLLNKAQVNGYDPLTAQSHGAIESWSWLGSDYEILLPRWFYNGFRIVLWMHLWLPIDRHLEILPSLLKCNCSEITSYIKKFFYNRQLRTIRIVIKEL